MQLRGFITGLMLLMSTVPGFAQDFSWGPKIGLTHPNVDQAVESWEGFSDDLGYHGGLFVRATFSGFHIQPELMFHRTNREIQIESQRFEEKIDVDYNKVNFTVLGGKKFLEFLRLTAGPLVNFHLNNDIDADNVDDINVDFNELSLGAQGGIGFDFWQIVLDLKYQVSLSRLAENVQVKDQVFDTKVEGNFFIFEVGYRFGED